MTLMISREDLQMQALPPIRGFNTKDPPHKLPEGQGIDAWNVEIDEVVGINKRSGFSLYNSASALMPRYNAGTIKEITGAMVYGSGTAWTGSVCKGNDVLFMLGNSSPLYWQIATNVGTATLSLAVAYSQTVTASSYILGPKEVGSLYNWKYGTTQKLITFAGQDLFTGNNTLTSTFTKVSAALTDYARVIAVPFQDKLYFCNGYEFKSYDGSSVAAVSGSPTPSDPKFVEVFTIGNANWLWIGGSKTAAYKSAYAFCDVNAPSTWPATNVYYAGDRDGQTVTGGKPIPGGFAVFKESSIYVFSGIPGAGTQRKVVSDVGCVASQSLVAFEGGVFFVGRKSGKLGAFRFNGEGVEDLAYCIEPTLEALSQANDDLITATIKDDKYIISATASGGSYNTRHFTCYFKRPFKGNSKPYFPWVRGNRGYASLTNFDVSGVNYLLAGSPTNGFVNVEAQTDSDNTTDNIFGATAAINSYVDTQWFNMGDLTAKKELLRAYLDLTESGSWNLDLYFYKDFQTYGADKYQISLGSTELTWAEIVYLQTVWQSKTDKAIEEVLFRFPAYATHSRFRWANSSAAQPFTVYPMTIEYRKENR